jgi:hypothetical protein
LRRRTANPFILAIVATAALWMGAAVVAQTPTPALCLPLGVDQPRLAIESLDVIVIGRLERNAEQWSLVPETYLKGPATERRLPLDTDAAPGCEPAALNAGQRVLVGLHADEPGDASWWPAANQAWLLEGEAATGAGGSVATDDLVGSIRDVTGQFAVPAEDSDSGVSLDVGGTILPLSIALVVIFVISILMMRIWHAIDPS